MECKRRAGLTKDFRVPGEAPQLASGVVRAFECRVRWRKAAILGVGLLGGSLGLALRRRALVDQVAGLVRRPETATEALRVGAVDVAWPDLDAVLQGADLVVLCTPLGQMAALAARFAGRLERGALVTDVGSTKVSVIEAVEAAVAAAGGRFVASHPMAGSEKTGVAASREDLFQGAVTVVTPTPATDPGALQETQRLWAAMGSRVVLMEAAAHDAVVARSSHLPHLVAASLVRAVLVGGASPEVAQLCATGFRDTTRVASGSPEMWRDIGLANRQEILAAVDAFSAALAEMRSLLAAGDAAALEEALRQSKASRDAWYQQAFRPVEGGQ